MYAIRSYYEYMIRMSGKMAKRVIDTDDDDDSPDSMKDELYDNLSDNFSDMEFPAEEDDVEDVPDVADEADDRITSYNVCYTKLLR